MPAANQNEITLEGLGRFLGRIGFDQRAEIGNSMAFHHHQTGTIIVLSVPSDGRFVRSADLLSVAMRLEAEQLVSDEMLEQFKAGKLPMT